MLRLLRLALGLILLAGAGWTLAPHLVSIVGTSGVVNAPLLTLRSPVDGTVTGASRSLGEALRKGEAVVVVQGSRAARDALEEAEVRAKSLISERAALVARIEVLDTQIVDLGRRAALHQALASAWLGRREEMVRARAEVLDARVAILTDRLARARALEGRAISAAQRGELELELVALEAERRGVRAEAAAIGVEREAADRGVALDLGAGEGLYARQTLDSRAIERSELAAQLARIDADLEAVQTRIVQARATLDRQARFAPEAPVAGAVWTNSPAVGSAVVTGDVVAQILDCENRFLEVTASERHFGRLEVSTPASVRLRGSDDWRSARVVSLMGAGALIREADFAARARNVGTGELRVILTYTDPAAVSSRFCDVGRTIDVRFHSPTLASEAWAWLNGGNLISRLAGLSPADEIVAPSPDGL